MEITKEQVQSYIEKNFDTFFVDALAKYIKDVMFPETDKESREEYRHELKQLIWESVAHGTKDFLQEYDFDATKIIAKEFMREFSNKEISIHFD